MSSGLTSRVVVSPATLIDILRRHREERPDQLAFTFLQEDGESLRWTYAELDRHSRRVAGALLKMGLVSGDRVLLLMPPGLDFIAAFIGCLYADLVAVPAYPPASRRHLPRVRSIIRDCRPALALTSSVAAPRLRRFMEGLGESLNWLVVDDLDGATDLVDSAAGPKADGLAFLQYTSGSTSTPKGVRVSHRNLLHNEALIQRGFGLDESAVVVGWLPLYHDMGLIGQVLQPLYLGARAVLMSPVSFLRRPLTWLEAISRFRGTVSGGPNFAYDLCTEKLADLEPGTLDLSGWRVAFNGAEPVRAETLDRFSEVMARQGFSRRAFFPCYGLAEATLMVTGGNPQAEPTVRRFRAAELEANRAVLVEEDAVLVEEDAVLVEEIVARRLVSSGQADAEQELLIVDPETGRACLEGVVGEIWLAGDSVADGYWRNPEATVRDFGAQLAGEKDGKAFLRTGDLGFLRNDELFVTGRLKDLIILRGRNHYPQDLERSAENAHPGLRSGCCAAFEVEDEAVLRLVLVAEVARHPGADPAEIVEQVRAAVSAEHEVRVDEVVLIRAGSIAKTSSGKIQRFAVRDEYLRDQLRVVERGSLAASADTPDLMERGLIEVSKADERDPIEDELVASFARLTRIPVAAVQRDQPLVAQGLDSLIAIQLQQEARDRWGEGGDRIELEALLEGATIEQLAASVLEGDAALKNSGTSAGEITTEASAELYPLSAGQRALWFLHCLAPNSSAYHLGGVARVLGSLDTHALRQAWRALLTQHPALRTTFESIDGEPWARVQPLSGDSDWVHAIELEIHQAPPESFTDLARQQIEQPFDLEREPPARLRVLGVEAASRERSSSSEHWLVLSLHHIVSDFWSIALMLHDLDQLYRAACEGAEPDLAPRTSTYGDFVAWQQQLLASSEGERLLNFWHSELDPPPPALDLPTDRAHPPTESYVGARSPVRLPKELAERLLSLGRDREGATPFMTVLALFQTLLWRYHGQRDFALGSPITLRDRPEWTEVVGYFVNTVVLRSRLAEASTFADLLGRTRPAVIAAFAHREMPFPKLVEALRPPIQDGRNALFQVMLAWQRDRRAEESGLAAFALAEEPASLRLGEARAEAVRLDPNAAPFELTLSLTESARGIEGVWIYRQDLFDEVTIQRFSRHLVQLAWDLVEHPDEPLVDRSLLSAVERHQTLVEWNHCEPAYEPVAGRLLHELVGEQAAARPDALAVVGQDEVLSYGAMWRAAGGVAACLRRTGFGPEQLAVLALQRRPPMLVGLLGILRAGGAWLPLDLGVPSERQAAILEQVREVFGAPRVVTEATSMERFTEHEPLRVSKASWVLDVDDAHRYAPRHEDLVEEMRPSLDHPAYVIFTSGSTGRPKGVVIPHRAATNRLLWVRAMEPPESFLHKTSIGFDLSVVEIFGPLVSGGRVVLARPGGQQDPDHLLKRIAEERVTCASFLPTHFQMILDRQGLSACPSLTTMMTGGEVVPAELPLALFDQARVDLHNRYGPTETTVSVISWKFPRQREVSTPIGRPIARTRITLFDSGLSPVPIGVLGEICISGESLARGYAGRAAETASVFVPDPLSAEPGSRLYRSGDQGRFRADGAIEFFGRRDHQIKIRGYRVELGEIEAALLEQPEISMARVLVREAQRRDEGNVEKDDVHRLVAFVVPEDGATFTGDALRERLGESLPDYMIPAVIVPLDTFPLNASGKVDRRALQRLELPVEITEDAIHAPPRNPKEEALVGIYARLLNRQQVGIHDSFFELGGHSLLATRAVTRINEHFGLELSLRMIFDKPTVAEFAEHLEQLGGSSSKPRPSLVARGLTSAKLSSAQQRLWFLERLEPGTSRHNIPAAIYLRGNLSVSALEIAFNEVIRRHEVLRTVFAVDSEGEGQQNIQPFVGRALPLIDLRHGIDQVSFLIDAEARRPFDLEKGPLLRFYLLRLKVDEHLLLLNQHHIISDGWSSEILIGELTALYRFALSGELSPLPELPIQYADFAVWQRAWIERDAAQARDLDFWRQQLADFEPMEWPNDRPRPAQLDHHGDEVCVQLTDSLSHDLDALSRRQGMTPFLTWLTLVTALLSRWCNQPEVMVGTPVAGRLQPEVERLIGFFVNMLVLRLHPGSQMTLNECLQQTRRVVLDAQDHQDLPFERLVQALAEVDLSRTPLFDVLLRVLEKPQAMDFEGLEATLQPQRRDTSAFDLEWTAQPMPEGWEIRCRYRTALFDRTTIQRLMASLLGWIEKVLAQPEVVLSDLDFLHPSQRHQLLFEWNDQWLSASETPIPHRIIANARQSPDAIAAVAADGDLSFAELVDRSRAWTPQFEPEALYGVFLEPSSARMIVLLAILEAGAAYVPLDPSYPRERLAFMIADAELAGIVTTADLVARVPAEGCPLLKIDEPVDIAAPAEFAIRQVSDLDPNRLAYVIYTSGSTGQPKGVAISHGALSGFLTGIESAIGLTSNDVFLAVTPLSFDISGLELFWPLIRGARLELASRTTARDGQALAEELLRSRATVMQGTPATWQMLVASLSAEKLARLRVLCGGESLPPPLAQTLAVETKAAWNLYGPTEATIWATTWRVDSARSRLGRPLGNTSCYVLDAALQPVLVGTPGQLFLAGSGLARGYLGRPGLSAERFLPCPFAEHPGARMYQTGDLTRQLANGDLDFLGRLDHQVKVRGFRVELGEIEAVLSRVSEVREAVVRVDEEARLIAYWAGEVTAEALRDALRDVLPDHMVPSFFVELEALPRLPNGKIDRSALPEARGQMTAQRHQAPETSIEERLVEIWQDVLGVDEAISVEASFFDVGGHSLLATRLLARIREGFGVDCSLQTLFAAPRIRQLGEHIEAAWRQGGLRRLPPLLRRGEATAELSFAQQRLWFLDRLEPGSAQFNLPASIHLAGPLDIRAFREAIQKVVQRHGILRTTFATIDGIACQVIHPPQSLNLPVIDVRGMSESRVRSVARREVSQPFDLAEGPLVRVRLLRLGEDEHLLLVVMHHIVSDGWSGQILLRELRAFYGECLGLASPTIPELAVQYADYARWQRDLLETDGAFDLQLDYWREQLADLPTIEWPTDRPRPANLDPAGDEVQIELDADLAEALAKVQREQGVTSFMALFAALSTLLARWTGERELVVGSPVAGRNHPALEDLIGFFVNLLTLHVRREPGLTFVGLLTQVRRTLLEAQEHQDLPFERLVQALAKTDPSRTPLFQAVLSVVDEAPSLDLPGIRSTVWPMARQVVQFDLEFQLQPHGSGWLLLCRYRTALFDRTTIERLLSDFRALLGEALACPEAALETLATLSPSQRQQLLREWNDQPFTRSETTVFERIASQARQRPDAIAVASVEGELSFAALIDRSEALALRLNEGALYGIFLEPSPSRIVGLLAILAAGSAYVPLDPSYPRERLAFMIEDAKLTGILTTSELVTQVPAAEHCLLLDIGETSEISKTRRARAVDPLALAYVIYTSGSTGKPKGVAISHGALSGFLSAIDDAIGLAPSDVFLAVTPLSFDISGLEVFWPLLRGARLELAERSVTREGRALAEKLRRGRVTMMQATPATWQMLLAARTAMPLAGLRALCGGETLPPQLAAVFAREAEAAWNLYGPTEATIWSTTWKVKPSRPRLGRPLGNTACYLLDVDLNPVPLGSPGELFLAGSGLARGYLARPGLSSTRFVPCRFGEKPGARMYRTGDLVRQRTDGALDFLGRSDDQVKVRGYRIELGEIEAVLGRQKPVREAVVVVEGRGEHVQITAYWVGEEEVESTTNEALREALRQTLPEYMVPSFFVELKALPRLPNGKVDRGALPASHRVVPAKGYSAPETSIEERLATIWQTLLGLEKAISVEDSFFDLGGHSLLATQLLARIREAFDVELSLQTLFAAPSVRQFAGRIEEALQSGRLRRLPSLRRHGEAVADLSFAQQRLWFLDRLEPGGAQFNLPVAIRLEGRLDVAALRGAAQEVVWRHDILRTNFVESQGIARQIIHPRSTLSLPVIDISLLGEGDELRKQVDLEVHRPFDLEQGPLVRIRLLLLGEEKHLLLVTMHHIVSDGWSNQILIRELSVFYGAFSEERVEDPLVPELSVQYADYARWQRERLAEGGLLDQQLVYWRTQLANLPTLEWPTDRPRPATLNTAGDEIHLRLNPELARSLSAMKKRHGATSFMILLTGLMSLLGRWTGQRDVVVGTPVAGRGHSALENLIGFFVNLLVIRAQLPRRSSFAERLASVRRAVLEAQEHQDLPFERLVQDLASMDPSRTPLFQTLLTVMDEAPRLSLPGIRVRPWPIRRRLAPYDLDFQLQSSAGGWLLLCRYATALFDRITVERLLAGFRSLLEGALTYPEAPFEELASLSSAQRHQLLHEWNDKPFAKPETSVHERIVERARLLHHTVALAAVDGQLTYGELLRQARGWATRLEAGAFYGVFLEPSPARIVALLAVLEAGAAYVPLDPAYPRERLAYMIEDADLAGILTHSDLANEVPEDDRPLLLLDERAESTGREPTRPHRRDLTHDLAYVIYTSGSTGKPKGVAISHGALSGFLSAIDDAIGLAPSDIFLALTPLSFDISGLEIFWPLLRGARLELASRAVAREGQALAAERRRCRATVMQATPATWQMLLASRDPEEPSPLAGLRVLCGGEALPITLAEALSHDALGAWNLYGPTEATIWATIWKLEDARPRLGRPRLGRPLGNTDCYVLGADLRPAPIGTAGELCLAGSGLARGYLRRPGFSAERFLPCPFGATPGVRMYRTGDRVRQLADGALDFLGRLDHQVKVRGFRIELGEIEAVLSRALGVREVVVLSDSVSSAGQSGGASRLIAYWTGEAEAEALREELHRSVPDYMIPSFFVALDELPRLPNGKVDRRALPSPDLETSFTKLPFVAPRHATERKIAEIWRQVLTVKRIGIDDSFFDLGGHSLLATQVVSRFRHEFAIELPLSRFFDTPTIRTQAIAVAELAAENAAASPSTLAIDASAIRGASEDRAPLSFAQQGLWFRDRIEPGSARYNMPAAIQLFGRLDIATLNGVFGEVLRRHEVLRTTFFEVEGVPWQQIQPWQPVSIPIIDLETLDEPIERWIDAEGRRPFELERGPLLRFKLLRCSTEEHHLLVTLHHIVADGWSIGILVREISLLYGAYCADPAGSSPMPLTELPLQYADFARWQRQHISPEVLRAELAWWRGQVADVPVLEWPRDRPRVEGDRGGDLVRCELSAERTAKLETLARRGGTTLFTTLLAAFQILLQRFCGQRDFAVGTPIAGRQDVAFEPLIGLFVNTLVIRSESAGNCFESRVAALHQRWLEVWRHQDLPYERLIQSFEDGGHRNLSREPLLQVLFALQNMPIRAYELSGLRLVPHLHSSLRAAKFDLDATLIPSRGGLVGRFEFSLNLFDRTTVKRLARAFVTLLETVSEAPQKPLSDLDLWTAQERHQLLIEEDRSRGEAGEVALVPEQVTVWGAQTPDAVAVRSESEALSYAELAERAKRLAGWLQGRGVGPETRIGVWMEGSAWQVIALLGVFEAGAAYVGLDPNAPFERLEFQLTDSNARFLLTERELADRVLDSAVPVLAVEDLAMSSTEARPVELDPSMLAYVIYTSGSTGRPKGVEVAHRGLAELIAWHRRRYDVQSDDQASLVANPSFDASVWELWPYLCAGASLFIPTAEALAEPAALVELFERQRITLSFLPTPLAEAMFNEFEGRKVLLRALLIGGDRLRRGPKEDLGFALVNHYGPTESTVVATASRVDPGEALPPIGRAIIGRRVSLLDPRLRPVLWGAVGHLHLAGVGLARGYARRPSITATSFLPDPFRSSAGGRLYRTGDLARYRDDGQLEFLGRIDHQVKLRGLRIELGEVEATLVEHPVVRQAVALVRDQRLVAFATLVEGGQTERIREDLRKLLPEYMVPTPLVEVESLPLLSSGKVDRAAVARFELQDSERSSEAPRNETEKALAGIFVELLEARQFGIHDSFFDLGGHSLLATQALARIQRRFGTELPLRTLFERPTIAELGEILGREEAESNQDGEIERRGASEAELSFAQERLWFLDQLFLDQRGTGARAYTLPGLLRLRGELSVSALFAALNQIVDRHESLRTTFYSVDGRPVQRIAQAREIRPELVDLSRLSRADDVAQGLVETARCSGFDLDQGPLIRWLLLRLGSAEHLFYFDMHHIISDGWSVGILVRELSAFYAAALRSEKTSHSSTLGMPPLNIQYADFAVWQRRTLKSDLLRRELDFWRQSLAGAPTSLDLPTDRPRAAVRTGRAGVYRFAWARDLGTALEQLALDRRASLFMVLMAAFKTLLLRLTGQVDLVVGTPVANRRRKEIEPLIGFFVNTLVLRTDLRGRSNPPWTDLLAKVRSVALEAFDHQDMPFERLVAELQPERERGQTPLFQTLLVLQNTERTSFALPGLELAFEKLEPAAAKFDLTIWLESAPDGLGGGFEYDADLFDATTVARWAGHLETLLHGLIAGPESRLYELPWLSAAETKQLRVWAVKPRREDPALPLHASFARGASGQPHAIALVDGSSALTYGELATRSHGLARSLVSRLAEPRGARIGIYVERTAETVVAILAVLEAGGVYVPLDAAYPVQRLAHIAADARMVLLLTEPNLEERVPEGDFAVETAWKEMQSENCLDVVMPEVDPLDLAYIIYTSGSTGRPKGTPIAHHQVSSLLTATAERLAFGPERTWTFFHSHAFDFSVWEIWGSLIYGARLIVVPYLVSRSPAAFTELLVEERVSVLNQTPTAFLQLLEGLLVSPAWCYLQQVMFGGEALAPARLEAALSSEEGPRLINFYGITETTVHVTWRWLSLDDARRGGSPVGKALPHLYLRLLDPTLRPVAIGVAAEICVGGVGASQGYLDRSALTAQRFVPDPEASRGERLYRSGDLGRYLPTGEVLFLGRLDHQVKIRGFRIELGEIEAALKRLETVSQAAVLALPDSAGSHRLVAWWVPAQHGGEEHRHDEPEDLRAALAEALPEYMIPTVWMRLDGLPLTAHGKLDRAALPEPDLAQASSAVYRAPRSELERKLVEIWKDLLGLEQVGIDDNFFHLGGHSLLATQMLSRIKSELGMTPELGRLFDQPTIAQLAEVLWQEEVEVKEDDLADLFDELDGMSEEEVLALLGEDEE